MASHTVRAGPLRRRLGGVVSEQQASEDAIRNEPFIEGAPDHRKRTARQDRHTAKSQLHRVAGDDDALEDVDLTAPPPHDLGRHASPAPPKSPKPGRRRGFKVWKTPFWKRRRSLWARQNAEARRLEKEE
jgi:hypothetical protein